MIKGYSKLSDTEKNEVCKFISRNFNVIKSIDEIERLFNNKVNGYGEGSLFYFINGKIVGEINIVLEACENLGIVYIHTIEVLEELKDKKHIVKNLVDEALKLSKKHDPSEIYLGAKNEEILNILESLGFKKEYAAFSMILDDKNKKEECLDLIKLSNENKNVYLNTYNNSFNDMPHGYFLNLSEVEEYINKTDNKNYFFMVAKSNTIIGFMNCEIQGERSLFDIGLKKEYRGKGYGKPLLETAIDFLNKKMVDNIELTVIEKNSIAYNMYKKRGFKEKSVLSYWMKIKLT